MCRPDAARRHAAGVRDHVLQRPPGHVLHVEQPQSAVGQLPLIVDADNVRMVELSQRLRFEAAIARDLQSHQPLHGDLPGQKDRGKGALAQRSQQVEIVDALPRLEGRSAATPATVQGR